MCCTTTFRSSVPEGIAYKEIEITGYLEGVKVYEEELLSEEKVESTKT